MATLNESSTALVAAVTADEAALVTLEAASVEASSDAEQLMAKVAARAKLMIARWHR